MIKCFTSNILHTWEEAAAAGDQAGGGEFAGLYLKLAADFPALVQPQAAGVEPFLRKLQERSVTAAVVAAEGLDLFRLAAGRENQEEVERLFTPLLELAGRLNSEAAIVIPAPALRAEEEAGFSYERAFNQLFLRLEGLTAAAQRRRVNLAVENPGGHLLLSPLELRDLIDQINSPHLGVCFNPGHARRFGKPLDWAEILNHRILAAKVPAHFAEDENQQELLAYFETLHPDLPVIGRNIFYHEGHEERKGKKRF